MPKPKHARRTASGGGAKTSGRSGRTQSIEAAAGERIRVEYGNPGAVVRRAVITVAQSCDIERGNEDEPPPSRDACLLSLPANVAVADLLRFLAPVRQDIARTRFLRDADEATPIVLASFVSADRALRFVQYYNGKTVSALDSSACRARIVLDRGNVGCASRGSGAVGSGAAASVTDGGKGGLRCPVCLEDVSTAATDVVTTVCNHVFHGECLAKCPDASCPVCRHTQAGADAGSDNKCSDCNAREVRACFPWTVPWQPEARRHGSPV